MPSSVQSTGREAAMIAMLVPRTDNKIMGPILPAKVVSHRLKGESMERVWEGSGCGYECHPQRENKTGYMKGV